MNPDYILFNHMRNLKMKKNKKFIRIKDMTISELIKRINKDDRSKSNLCQYQTKKDTPRFDLVGKIQNWYRFWKRQRVLWRIADYYTARKYAPENILKYLDLNE